jgi:hypothetical protein
MYKEFSIMFGESFRKAVDDFLKNGASLSGGDESFRKGYLMGLHRVFTLMEQRLMFVIFRSSQSAWKGWRSMTF